MQKPTLQLASVQGVHLERGSLVAAGSGRALLASSSGALSSIALPSGISQTVSLPCTGKPLGCITYSQAARALAAGEAGFKPVVAVWFDGQPPEQPALVLKGHNFGIAALAWSPRGVLLASTGAEKDRQLMLWNPVSGVQVGRARLAEDYQCLEFLDEKVLCAINGTALTVWALDKTVCGGRKNTQYKLTPKRYTLDLPGSAAAAVAAGPSKPPPRVLRLACVQSAGAAGAAGRRLWAALDAGLILQLRTSGKCERVLDLTKVGRLLDMAASATHIACASSGGDLRVYSAATLEEEAALACPDAPMNPALRPATAACAFSPDGARLTALFSNGQLCSWECSSPAEPALDYSASFHTSPITDAVIIKRGSCSFLASCSQGGKVQLQQLEEKEGGQLHRPPVTADLRQRQQLHGVRLVSLAACPSGSLLAAGDTTGSIHLFAIFDTSPEYFRTVDVHATEVTALSFAPPLTSGPHSCQLLTVGSKSGALTVLDSMHSYAAVAWLQQPQQGAAVVSAKWVQNAGRLQLLAAMRDGSLRDGSLRAYSLSTSPEGVVALSPIESFRPPAPKGTLVAMHTVVLGQAAAAGSREGSISIFDAFSSEALVSMTADRNAGEVTSMALDEGMCIAVTATSKNLLQIYDRESGKVLATTKAHLSGTAISRVLISPSTSHIVTVGEDACVRVWAVPVDIKLKCLAEQEMLRQTVQLMSGTKSGATSTVLSELHPQNLFDKHFQALSLTSGRALASPPLGEAAGEGKGEGEEVSSGSLEAEAVGASAADAAAAAGEQDEAGPLQQEVEAEQEDKVAPPPSSPRQQGIMKGLADQLGQLEVQLLAMKQSPRRRPTVEERMAAMEKSSPGQPSAIPQQQPPPVEPSPAAATSLAAYFRSGGSSRAASPASRLVQADGGSAHAAAQLRQPRSSSRHQPWRSPREGAGLWVAMEGDGIAAAEAERCAALLHVIEDGEVAQVLPPAAEAVQAAAAPSVAAAAMPAAAASAPASGRRPAPEAACPESLGLVSSGPRRKRACWDFGSTASGTAVAGRRPLSSLGGRMEGTNAVSDMQPEGPSTALGIDSSPSPGPGEAFTIWSDPSTPCATLGSQLSIAHAGEGHAGAGEGAKPPARASSPDSTGSAGSSAASRRLTFSFNMGPLASSLTSTKEEGDTPSFLGKAKQPAAAVATVEGQRVEMANPALALEPAGTEASTLSLSFGPAHAPAPLLGQASISKPSSGARHLSLSAVADITSASPAAAAAGAPTGAGSALRVRPPIPRLVLPGSLPASPASPAAMGPAFPSHKDTPLRQQYSVRSSINGEASPPHPAQQQGQQEGFISHLPAATGNSWASGGSYATTSSSSNELVSESGTMEEEEEEEGDVFSSPDPRLPLPTLHHNQLFEGSATFLPGASLVDGGFKPASAAGICPNTSLTTEAEAAAAAPRAAAAATLAPPQSADSEAGSGGSGSSNMSAFNRPPVYDPLEPSSGPPEGAHAGGGGGPAGSKRRRQRTPPGTHHANELFGATPASATKVPRPFSTFNAGSYDIAMVKNPAFALTPDASPSATRGAPNLRRMSTFLPAGPAAAAAGAHLPKAAAPPAAAPPTSPGATATAAVQAVVQAGDPAGGMAQGANMAGSGQCASPGIASSTDSQANVVLGPVRPDQVLSMFEAAMHGLQALQAQGRADAELLGKLAEMGIAFGMGTGGGRGTREEGSCGSRPSVGNVVPDVEEPEEELTLASAFSGGDRATIKAEILRELRRDIAAGALKL